MLRINFTISSIQSDFSHISLIILIPVYLIGKLKLLSDFRFLSRKCRGAAREADPRRAVTEAHDPPTLLTEETTLALPGWFDFVIMVIVVSFYLRSLT